MNKILSLIIAVFLAISSAWAQPTQRTLLVNLQQAKTVESSKAGQIGLTDAQGNQRYAQYVEVDLVPIAYTPTATGNTQNYSEFVTTATGDVWYIDWQGRAVKVSGSGGSGCDYDWLQISDNSCPNAITDSIYKYRYASIGARYVWPLAQLLLNDSIREAAAVIAGQRGSSLVLYNNIGGKFSTLQQAGTGASITIDSTANFTIQYAAGGTPALPTITTPILQMSAQDSTLRLNAFGSSRRADTAALNNVAYFDALGRFRKRPVTDLPAGGTVARPLDEVVKGTGPGITSDTTHKYLLSTIPGLSPQANVLQLGRKVVGPGTNPLSAIRLKNKYGYWYGGVAPAKTANVHFFIDNPTDDSYSVPWMLSQNAYNNNANVPPGISGTTDSTYNNVMKWGFNPDGIAFPNRQGIWDAEEPSWGNGGQAWMERHMSLRGAADGSKMSALGGGERRFFTMVAQNLNSAPNYTNNIGLGADIVSFSQFHIASNLMHTGDANYARLSRDFSSKIANFSLISTPSAGIGIAADSASSLFRIYNSSASGLWINQQFQVRDFGRYLTNDYLNRNVWNYFSSTNAMSFGSTAAGHTMGYNFLSSNSNGGNAFVILSDLTSSLYSARGQFFIQNAAGTAGVGQGYRSDALFYYLAGIGNIPAYSASMKKFSFGRTISGTYPKGSAFYNIYTEQANTVAALLLSTTTDSSRVFKSAADPNSVITGRVGDISIGSDGIFYTKPTGNNTNTGWTGLLSGSTGWKINGNTVGAVNQWIGTIDNQSFKIRTNNTFAVKIDTMQQMGIGVENITASLHIRAGAAAAGMGQIKLDSSAELSVKEKGTINYIGKSISTTLNDSLRVTLPGVIWGDTDAAKSVGTSETNLYVKQIKGRTFNNIGSSIHSVVCGNLADATSVNAQLRFYLGGTLIMDTGAAAVTAVSGWQADVYIENTASNTLQACVKIFAPGLTGQIFVTNTTLTGLSLGNPLQFKITATATGAGASNDDITAQWQKGTFYPTERP